MPVSQARGHVALVTDTAGAIVTWNDASAKLFGYAGSDVVGMPLSSLLAPSGRPAFAEHWPEPPEHAEAVELTIQHADGSSSPSRLSLAPQYAPDGAFRGCVILFSALREVHVSERSLVGATPLSAIVNVFNGTFYVVNESGHFVLWNRNLERVTDMTPEELASTTALDMFAPRERPAIAEKMRQVFEDGAEVVAEGNYVSKHGKSTPYLMCGTRITCEGKHYLCGIGIDITQRRTQEEALRVRDRALHAASNGIVITRCAGNDNPIEYVNPAFERISGYTAADVLGRDPRFMAAPGLDDDERALLRAAIRARSNCTVVLRNSRKDGELFWNELAITPVQGDQGNVTHFVGVINDVTALKQRTAHLEHEINHDPLTGLANRNLMWDRLEQALHMAQRNKTLVAVILVDLDGFKLINDRLGHEAGDEVLTVVARRLESAVRDSDTVARLSGDEFVLVLANQPSLRYTLRMVERLRQSMSKPVAFDNAEIPVGASMGVSVFPHDGTTAFDLVRAADVAMYHAKAGGKSDVHFFSPDMKSTTEAKQKLEHSMNAALANDEFFLLYQPRLSLRTGAIVGVEALVRWRHPEQGILLPGAFLSEAEDSGMIIPIGRRVLDQVCALLAELRQRGLPGLAVSMNVSYREFSQHNFINEVAASVGRAGLLPSSLELELREEHLLRNLHLTREIATQMHELGLKLSVDDFGEGLTSLGYLQKLPVSHLKLSRTAVREICPKSLSGPMAKILIDIGHNLNISVVGEGVETLSQVDFLRSNGCDEVQGCYFSEPLEHDSLQRKLSSMDVAGTLSLRL